jgi:hypothetical protein
MTSIEQMASPVKPARRVGGIYVLTPGVPGGEPHCYIRVPCPACHGSGFVQPGRHKDEDERCSTCDTWGEVEAAACLHCLHPSVPLLEDQQPALAEAFAEQGAYHAMPLCDGAPGNCFPRTAVLNPPLLLSEDEHRHAVDWLCDAIADPVFDKAAIDLLNKLDREAARRVIARYGIAPAENF